MIERTILTVAALLWCHAALANSQVQNAKDLEGDPVLPAGPLDRPALSETPDRRAGPEREAKQEALRREVAA